MDNLEYLVGAYTVVWLAFFGYLVVLSRKQRQLRQDIDLLKAESEDSQKKNDQ
jgi:CcmD family protein